MTRDDDMRHDLPPFADPALSPACVAETHGAVLLMCGDTVWKRKKPVRTDVFDFTTIEARERALRDEFALNRRLAPDVYLDVLAVVGSDGAAIDHVLAMRRMPPERRLAALAGDDVDLRAVIRSIARSVAGFHAAAARSARIDEAGTPSHLASIWRANVTALSSDETVDAGRVAAIRDHAFDYIAGRHPLFAQRIAHGAIVDGHGDLLADDIFCLDDGPRILDCVEFDAGLRHGDVVADVAFLAMDLERIGRPDAANWFLDDYREFSNERWPASLAHHWIALRAFTRAKVACVRHHQGDPDAAGAARACLDIAWTHCRAAEVRAVLIGGPPGTGKSTLAAALSQRLGWTVLQSDAIRAELSRAPDGPAPHDRSMDDLVYATLVRRARAAVEVGESVILDATWSAGERRKGAERAMREAHATLTRLRCDCDPERAADRAQQRKEEGRDVSDADADVARLIAARFDAWPEATVVDTDADPAAALDVALESLIR